MRKFTKLDWFYMICAYFMSFGFVGIIFNSIPLIMPWSISIFIILYIAYWLIRYFIDMKDLFFIQMELLKEQTDEDIKKYDTK